MGVAYNIALYSKVTQSQHIFTTVTGSPAITGTFGWSQMVSLVSALSMAMCP